MPPAITATVEVKVKLTIAIAVGVDPQEAVKSVIEDMDYSFQYHDADTGAAITDTEIVETSQAVVSYNTFIG